MRVACKWYNGFIMIKLDDDLLAQLGLAALPPDDKKRMLTHIYETLEMRVGMELAKQMSDQQLNEFEQFINRNDEPGALKWLETNFPNYKEVVAAEFEKLKTEIKQVAPQILQDAQAAAAQASQMPHPSQMSPQMQQPMPQPQYGPAPQPGYMPPQQQYQQPLPSAGYPASPTQMPQPQQAPYVPPQQRQPAQNENWDGSQPQSQPYQPRQ